MSSFEDEPVIARGILEAPEMVREEEEDPMTVDDDVLGTSLCSKEAELAEEKEAGERA